MQINKPTQFELQGRGVITLSANDHVATGGEGSIYRPANSRTIVKLYTDTGKMVRDGMPEKLNLLSNIKHPYVVSPTGLVLMNSKPVGYYMPFAKGEPLSRVFTTSWRQREGFGDSEATTLVARMREAVQAAHGAQAVMVDANELNWNVALGKSDGPEPRALDVDSWAIDRWPATVIMPSIRDWQSKEFNSLTDWFAWGIVTFQLFSGIHPYKGKLDGFKPNELERRMKEGASVFVPGVKLNRAVRDFRCIPGPLLDWYVATFQNSERTVPPSPFDTGLTTAKVAQIARVVITASGSLVYEKLFGNVTDPALRTFGCGVVLLESGCLIDLATKREIGVAKSRECEVVEVNGHWLKADIDNGEMIFSCINRKNLKEEVLNLQLEGRCFVRYENRLFVVADRGLTEVSLKILGKPILSVGKTWGAMVNSTRWYDGVGIQDAMGAIYVIAPFGENSCAQVRVKELDGLRVVAAKSGNRFVAIMTVDKNGQYRKVELTFDREYKTYETWAGGSDSPDLNMAVLPKGVTAIIVEDGSLNIFVPTNGKLRKVADKQISTDMVLGNWDNTVVYVQNGAVWSVKLNSK